MPASRTGRGSRVLGRLLRADESPPPRLTTLHREALVPASLQDTFAFFADAANLERLTPPWLNFTIRTAMPVVMGEGVVIDYQIGLYGIPIPWRSVIEVWEPGVRFVDLQVVGPYRWWRHEHRFEAAGSATKVVDHVEYQPRAAWLSGALVHRDLARIFTYRQETLARLFPPRQP
jgi:ligand-binding SRPBCC domain-containing protein